MGAASYRVSQAAMRCGFSRLQLSGFQTGDYCWSSRGRSIRSRTKDDRGGRDRLATLANTQRVMSEA